MVTQPVTGQERLAIRRFEESGPLDRAAVDRFLQENRFPLAEGPSVTFVYRGEADAVNLKHWVYALPSLQPLVRIAGTDLWYLVIELPEGSRVEYKFDVVRGGASQLIEDSLNPLRSHDPYGSNSVAHSSGYRAPDWVAKDPNAREGRLEQLALRSVHLGRQTTSHVYIPARFRRTRRYPLLVVHDGSDFLRYSGMKVVLDNLIHRLEIPDLVVVFSDPANRLREYTHCEAHTRFLTEELVPHVNATFPLSDKPAERALMGSSLGAVAALSAAWRSPGYYGRLLLLSGSFAFTDIGRKHRFGPLFDPVVTFMNAFRGRPKVVAERLFVGCGIYEPLIYENRSLVPLLQSIGMDVRYVESRDGHNWENWRDRLREGLSWLFPGPLMLVYE
ncbi:MAG: enterochelin esterase [Candidatus Riflebacteria bacterium]|nr:enterochelin esterase [Candidatus Riflebacteria bacterium]